MLDYSTFARKVNTGLPENGKLPTHERAAAPPQPLFVTKVPFSLVDDVNRRFVGKLNILKVPPKGNYSQLVTV